MLSDETYFCPACNATASPLEARTALYRCPHCSRGYLIARHPLPGIVRAVQPQGLAVEPDAQEAENSPPQSDESDVIRGRVHAPPTSLDEALWAALPGRRQARAQVMEADANTSPPPEESSSASAPTEPPSPKPKLHATPTVVLVLPPPYNEIDATAMEQMAATFSGLPSPVSLEIAGEQGQRRMLVRGAAAAVKSVVKQLYGVYRQVGAETLGPSEDPATTFDALNQFTIAAYLQPAGPEFLSLRTWREFEGNDPLNPLLGAFDGLGPSETALSQIILHGAAPERWAEPHLKQLVALKRRGYGAEVPAPTHHIVGFAGSTVVLIVSVLLGLWAYGDWHRWLVVAPVLLILALAAFGLFRLSGNPWAKTLDEEAAAKLRDPAFRIELRVFACAPTEARAREILDQVIAAYRLFNTTSGNQLRAVDPGQPLHPADLSPAEKIKPALLSVKEVAGLWHMPVGESLELVGRQTYECLLPLPRDVAHLDGALIGMSRKGDHEIRVHLSPEALQRNLFIIGKTQHGKSTFMEHVAAHWMRDPGRSVLIVDPHGDLARRVVGLVPPERVNDVVYIDLSDATQSVGLNLLDVSGGADPDDVAETFVDVGKALWQKYWGPRMLIPLGFGLRALAHANLRRPPERQYTILALATLLMCDSDVRAKFLRAEVPMDERPDVFRYFVGEYADGSAYQREQVISPVLSKAHAFERSAVIRRLDFVQELLGRFSAGLGMRPDRVVPLREHAVLDQTDGLLLLGCHFDFGQVAFPIQIGDAAQASFGGGCPNELQDRLETDQWLASPVGTDMIEQPMLNPVPFRSAGRVMCDNDRQADFVCQALQFPFPQPAAIAIGPAPVGLNQQLGRIGIGRPALGVPPAPNDIDSKLSRLMRDTYADETPIAGHIVDPIRNRLAIGIAGKISGQHRACFAAPGAPGVLEIADQFLLLGIHANCRLFSLQKRASLAGQIAHLLVSVGILSFAAFLAIVAQRVTQLLQQTPDGFTADLKLLATQLFNQLAQRLTDPLRAVDGVARRRILQQPAQCFKELGSFFSIVGRPAPARRTPGVRSVRRISSRPARMVMRLRPVIS